VKPLDLLKELDAINDRIRGAGRQRLELVERFNRELRDLIRDFEVTPDTFRVYVDLKKRLERIARRVEKARADDLLDYTQQFDRAFAVLKKRRFEAAIKELDRIPVLELLSEQRRLFDEYRRGYAVLRTRCEELEAEIRDKTAYFESLQKVDAVSFDALDVLNDKISSYNDRVGTFLESYFKEALLSDVIKISLGASYHPELGFPQPPSYENAERLLSFVQNKDIEALPLYRFLEYATYSDGKLTHYVGDPGTFKQVLESNIVWLDSLEHIKRHETLKISLEQSGVSLATKIPRIVAFLSKLDAPSTLLTFLREMQKLVTSGSYEKIRAASSVKRDHVKKVQQGAHVADLESLQNELEAVREELRELQEPREVERELA
jgi:hypothetical protein